MRVELQPQQSVRDPQRPPCNLDRATTTSASSCLSAAAHFAVGKPECQAQRGLSAAPAAYQGCIEAAAKALPEVNQVAARGPAGKGLEVVVAAVLQGALFVAPGIAKP